eukprot:TRINITY_DN4618_c0_g1_i3.p1 TRINITY_DN4618_c0_g1~~TRINITY_DN4618_c0_g1_i3.p1  ORF type:complete len:131 (+),score=23.37 TRINITY_DN4618_c0_g1_i3:25-393(+)
MIRRPPRSTHCISSAASDVYKRQVHNVPCTDCSKKNELTLQCPRTANPKFSWLNTWSELNEFHNQVIHAKTKDKEEVHLSTAENASPLRRPLEIQCESAIPEVAETRPVQLKVAVSLTSSHY